MPHILARVDRTMSPKGGGGKQLVRLCLEMLVAVRTDDVNRLAAHLHDEAHHSKQDIRVADKGEPLTVNVRMRVNHSVHNSAAFCFDRSGDLFSHELGELRKKSISVLDTYGR